MNPILFALGRVQMRATNGHHDIYLILGSEALFTVIDCECGPPNMVAFPPHLEVEAIAAFASLVKES